MNSLISSFSFYEILRILLPGTYLYLGLKESIIGEIARNLNTDPGIYQNTLVEVILICVFGLFIYAWDFPKMFKKFQKDLPTNKIQKITGIEYKKVLINYYDFYSTLSESEKLKTEKYSGFFHLSVNLSCCAFFLICLEIISIMKMGLTNFLLLNILIFVLSISTVFLIYTRRLKVAFIRHLDQHFESKYFQKLQSGINNP
ncbi:hypothetical protein OZ410_03680 [Robiginitalea sp. M366]|uniref:hypothetical protein n=1 Tax=Robiginitalea aestuariiviva TaxID=3036903 RepID=UPI00240DFBB5|nr:hypothetical protein [Robiginitalea aestuariiviva]MDG1571401.1 hypothetical protein [Robiginitalea aestuariiviva]